MHFTSTADVALARAETFRFTADPDWLERQALRRGISVERLSNVPPGPGMAWRAEGQWRDWTRAAEIMVTGWGAPDHVAFAANSGGVEAALTVRYTQLTRHRTRMHATLQVTPRRMRDRLFLSSVKLAVPNLGERFDRLIRNLAREAERRAASA